MQYRFTRMHKAYDIDLLFSYIQEKIQKKEKVKENKNNI